MTEKAVRLEDPPAGRIPEDLDMSRISYWQEEGRWLLYLPAGGLGDLSQHTVKEHEDGTITVSPSIAVTSGDQRRHGYLRRGVWEPCSDDRPPDGA